MSSYSKIIWSTKWVYKNVIVLTNLNLAYFSRKDKVRETPDGRDDKELAQKQKEGDHVVQDQDPQDVPHEEVEGILGRGAEVGALDGTHDVGVAVEEPHELFQAPEAALACLYQAPEEVKKRGLLKNLRARKGSHIT